MSGYEKIEKAIVERLAENFTPYGWKVEAMPNANADFSDNVDKPVITVGWAESSFSNSSVAAFSQDEHLSFVIVSRTKVLRDRKGAYALSEAILQALMGFRPSGAGNIEFESSKFAEFSDGIWSYEARIKCKRVMSGQLDQNLGPLITQIAFTNKDENTPEP